MLLKRKRTRSSCLRKVSRIKSLLTTFHIPSLLCFIFWLLPGNAEGQVIRKIPVQFKAPDGLTITADLYKSRKVYPYIILLHREGSSKAEFDSIVNRFAKLNYNCLVPDLRSGANLGYSKNLTAEAAREEGYSQSIEDASNDILGALAYLSNLTGKGIILAGSASSATLSLIIAKNSKQVKAVAAFSPGDYFPVTMPLKTVLESYPKPVYISCTAEEYSYFSSLPGLPAPGMVLFKPFSGPGKRGTEALLKENPTSNEYWLSVLIFFKSLQK